MEWGKCEGGREERWFYKEKSKYSFFTEYGGIVDRGGAKDEVGI